ncbi:MAG: hypothetical protein HN348_29215 [Proteobacteria bacterium]|nr:hypothetical protein [Pseudomonadota bacterium]
MDIHRGRSCSTSGGFGGGGSTDTWGHSGGAGGYSGGNNGRGGGSFSAGSNFSGAADAHDGPGMVVIDELLEVVSDFTTCGQLGRYGPSQGQCDGIDGAGVVTVQSGYQRWIVHSDGDYRITVAGARGGDIGNGRGGGGAIVAADFSLNAGDGLVMAIGQTGADRTCGYNAGEEYEFVGGGGTFVTLVGSGDWLTPLSVSVQPLVIGGGGAGANEDSCQ